MGRSDRCPRAPAARCGREPVAVRGVQPSMLQSISLVTALVMTTPPLPITKVRLQETGMATVTREGPLQHGAVISIPASHLDDVLKTLVIHVESGVMPTVRFPTRMAPGMALALANMPFDDE